MLSHTACLGKVSLSESWKDESLVDFLGRKGVKCLERSSGPIVFTENVSCICFWSSWEGDFSG